VPRFNDTPEIREYYEFMEYYPLCGLYRLHFTQEGSFARLQKALGKAPLLTAGLHLGEGTGAVASIPLWDMALAVYRDCYSFTEGGITPYTPQC
jgi:nicotinate-nucleotide--dimethylbenzimidazole phosphoribosyltransferase